MKIKKEGHGGKGSWGSTRDEIHDARQLINEGELPPISSPEREKSMRKLSISSSTSSEASANGSTPSTVPGTNSTEQADKIVEEETEWVDEPEGEEVKAASTSKI